MPKPNYSKVIRLLG